MPKKEAAPLDPLIIEEIKRREEERKRRENEREQPCIDTPNNIPEHDPEAEEKWEKERKDREKDPRGIERIDLT